MDPAADPDGGLPAADLPHRTAAFAEMAAVCLCWVCIPGPAGRGEHLRPGQCWLRAPGAQVPHRLRVPGVGPAAGLQPVVPAGWDGWCAGLLDPPLPSSRRRRAPPDQVVPLCLMPAATSI